MPPPADVPRLEGERVVLRGARLDDFGGRIRCGQHPEIVRMFGGQISHGRADRRGTSVV
jgi:hypothetical protein